MAQGSITPSKPSAGERLEALVAETWFWEGYFARRSIGLKRHYEPEPVQVTDLDLLAYDFDPHLRRRKYIGEAKGGKSKSVPRPLDRTIWLRGLSELVQADRAELVTALRVSPRVRQLAAGLDVTVQTVGDVKRRRAIGRIDDVADQGSHGEDIVSLLISAGRHCSTDPELERAYWFLRSDVWFLDAWTATKQSIGLIRQLAARWTPGVADEDTQFLRWGFAEAVSVFTVNAVTLAGFSLQIDQDHFRSTAKERLSEGIVPPQYQKRLSDAIDRYIGGVLEQVRAPAAARLEAMGAFEPTPPDYWESLVELASRLAATPQITRLLPRQIDLVAYETVVRQRTIEVATANRLPLDDDGSRMIRQVVAFLKGQAGLPGDVADAIGKGTPMMSIEVGQVTEDIQESAVLENGAAGSSDLEEDYQSNGESEDRNTNSREESTTQGALPIE